MLKITDEARQIYAETRAKIIAAETVEQFAEAATSGHGLLLVAGGEDHVFTLGGLRFMGFVNLIDAIEHQLQKEIREAAMLSETVGEA